jgi:hypothetical protein
MQCYLCEKELSEDKAWICNGCGEVFCSWCADEHQDECDDRNA